MKLSAEESRSPVKNRRHIICNWLPLFFLLVFMAGCSTVPMKDSGHKEADPKVISIDKELLKHSDYLELVYTNGVFSSLSYQKKEALGELKKGPYKKPDCLPTGQGQSLPSKGVWIWKYKNIIGHEKEVLEKLVRDKINRVYIQLGEDIEAYKVFMELARENSVVVFALDGAPEYIDDYSVLLNDLKRVLAFNKAHPDIKFAGLQIDVEPYLKKDFNIRKDYYIKRYIKMAQELRNLAGKETGLSFALPFWFDTLLSEGKPLSFWVIDLADEVAIMSYRTEYSEIIDSASDELCYAANTGKPIFLGIEITRLPDEQHFVIDKKEIARFLVISQGKMVLPQDPAAVIPITSKYEVKASKITLYENKDKLPGILNKVPPYASFSGYIIHSFEELYK